MDLNYDVKRIYEWPFAIQIIFLCAASFVLFYLAYLLDIASINNNIQSAKQQQKQLIKDFQLAVEARVRLENNLMQFPKLKSMIASWSSNIIAANEITATLDALIKLGEEAHVKFNLFDPGTEIKDGSYYKVPVKLSILGNYDQIATFISLVANYSKLIVVDDFSITGEPSSPNDSNIKNTNSINIMHGETPLIVQLTLEIYRR